MPARRDSREPRREIDNDDPCEETTRWPLYKVDREKRGRLDMDLMFGSLGRDPRTPRYRKMISHPQEWIETAIPGKWSDQDKAIARKALVIEYLFRRATIRAVAEAIPDTTEYKRAIAAWNCLPSILRRKSNEEDYKSHMRTNCKSAKVCPWCFCRSVRNTEKVFQQRVATQSHRKFVRVLIELGSEIIPPTTEDALAMFHFNLNSSEARTTRWKQASEYTIYREAEHRYMRGALNELVETAREFGIVGGARTHQIGPKFSSAESGRKDRLTDAYRHKLVVLGATDEEDIDPDEIVRAVKERLGRPNNHVDVIVAEHNAKSARELLTGTQNQDDQERLGRILSEGAAQKHGIRGAMELIPAYLFQPWVWLTFVGDTEFDGMRTVDYFGTWRIGGGQSKERREKCGEHNEKLLRVARAFWEKIKQRESPPKRKKPELLWLAQELSAAGLGNSRRTVSKLLRQLKEEDRQVNVPSIRAISAQRTGRAGAQLWPELDAR